jgi:hypothetical protein
MSAARYRPEATHIYEGLIAQTEQKGCYLSGWAELGGRGHSVLLSHGMGHASQSEYVTLGQLSLSER